MEIRDKSYTFPEFCREIQPPFKILCFLTVENEWAPPESIANLESLFRTSGFKIHSMGEMKKLTYQYVDRYTKERIPIDYFAYLDPETKVLLCFTQAKRRQIEDTIYPVVTGPGICHLWIPPSIMNQIKESILAQYRHAKITSFTAKRFSSMRFRGEIRPEFDRTLTYRGDDGEETLDEVRYYYGAFPTSMRFDIPAIMTFRIKNEGIFSLWKGEKESFFDIFNASLRMVLLVRKIIESSSFELVPVQMARKKLNVPALVPWIINFSKPLEYADGEMLVERLEKNGFRLLNSVLAQGSVLLDATVADEKKKFIFSISAGSDRMIVAPHHEVSSDSFFHFFHTIIETIDPEATCSSVEEV